MNATGPRRDDDRPAVGAGSLALASDGFGSAAVADAHVPSGGRPGGGPGGCGIRFDPDGVAQVFMTINGIEFLVTVGGEGTEVQLHFHGFPGVSQHWVPPEELYSADFAAETGVYVFEVPADCEMRVTQTVFAGRVRPEGVSVAGRIDRDGEPMYFSTLMTVAELDAAPALCARVRRALRRGP